MQRRTFLSFLSGLPFIRQFVPQRDDPEWCWFCYDPETGFDTYRTKEEALSAAQECIEECLGDCWCEHVEQVCVGRIEMIATKVNVVTREMLDEEGCYNGRHYGGLYDEWCSYEMRQKKTYA